MAKLTEQEYQSYWLNVHNKTPGDLEAVCFPHKPPYFNKFFDRTQRYAIQQFVEREQLPLHGKALLDVGCGRGRWLNFFHERYGTHVSGVDLSSEAISVCKSRGFNAFCADITKLPFENEEFDIVTSVTVLLHLPYPQKEAAVAEIVRVLKQNGTVILLENTWNDPAPHVYSLSLAQWEELLNRYRLRMIHKSAHCFNVARMHLPNRAVITPIIDFVSIALDYPIEYALMNFYYGKSSNRSLQHLMVFRKEGE
ncbi:MAG: class I SAM-dependent methyltransferase [Ignavibacteriae bacterium]|nr:class I SAM-dependent methyltransferase [Ignavibacteriota bacterium]